jgi:hypothetical protein
MRKQIIISFGLGLLVFIIALATVWLNLRGRFQLMREGAMTMSAIRQVQEAIAAYEQNNNQLPKNLGELAAIGYELNTDAKGVVVDAWQQPLQYWTDGKHYRVTSFGHDGKTGGVGIDLDLTSDDVSTQKDITLSTRPTFGQFYKVMPTTRNTVWASVIAGIFAFILSMVLSRRRTGRQTSLENIVIEIVAVAVISILVAGFSALLFIPKGA